MMRETPVKFFYGIPNSQNPSGCTYSQDRRREIAEMLKGTNTVFYEDDAFGELFFDGKPRSAGETLSSRKCRDLRIVLQDHRTGHADRVAVRPA